MGLSLPPFLPSFLSRTARSSAQAGGNTLDDGYTSDARVQQLILVRPPSVIFELSSTEESKEEVDRHRHRRRRANNCQLRPR